MRELGRYRHQILQPDGSQQSIMTMLTDYLGRAPNTAPYMNMLADTATRT